MDPLFFGAAVFGGLFLLSRRSSAAGESEGGDETYGHHLVGVPGFSQLPMDGKWDVYEYCGRNGKFTVAMSADLSGAFPVPGKTNISYFYPDGVEARVVRACGPSGCKWADTDIPGVHTYDLFVYHPANHPGEFPTVSFGAVSGWMGGRGPGAGTGLSSGGGGRQTANPFDWSGITSSGGFRRFHHPDEDLELPGEGEGVSYGDDGRVEREDNGQVWSDTYGWVSPAEPDSYGLNVLGINIPTSKQERLDRLDSKIEKAQQKLDDLESAAKEEGADIEKLAKQIASIQSQKERWEDKKNNLEVRMGGMPDPDEDDEDDDLDEEDDEFGLDDEYDLYGEDGGDELDAFGDFEDFDDFMESDEDLVL